MDVVTLSQSSFYEDDLPEGHLKIGAVSCQSKFDGKEPCLESVGQQLRGVKPIQEVEKDQHDESDFAVPNCKERECQSAEMGNRENIKNARSVYFLSQESRALLSSRFKKQEANRNTFSTECGILMSPPYKQPRLLESIRKDKRDTDLSEGLQKEQLYLDWNAQSHFESVAKNKAPTVWPAIGVRSFARENKVSTLTFFTLVEQARLLPQEQVDKLRRLHNVTHDKRSRKLASKRCNPSHVMNNSSAEKFLKIDPDAKEGNSIDELCIHARADQEVPIMKDVCEPDKKLGSEKETLERAQWPWNAESITSNVSLERPKVDSNVLRAKTSNDTVQMSCTDNICSRFGEKNAINLAQEPDGNTAGSGDTKGDSALSLQSHYHDKQVSDSPQIQVADHFAIDFPLLPVPRYGERGLCSSVRCIGESDLIGEVDSFNDFDRSPSRKTKASLTRESSSGYQKEKLQSFPDHSSVIRDINEHQNLEHLVSEPASPSQMASFVECFTQVRPFECSKNEFEDSLFHEQTLHSVRQNTLYTNEKNTPFNAAADSDHNDLQVPKENDDTLVGKQSEIFEPKQDNIDSASDISGQGKSTPLEVKESASNDPLDNIDDEKENRIDPSPRNAHLENKNGSKSFGCSVDNRSSPSSCDSRSNFRAQIEEDLLDLDGPELLQFAMMFVEGALKKSRTSISRVDQPQSQKRNVRALHAFPRKDKLIYGGQHAALLHTEKGNSSKRSVTESNQVCGEDGTKADHNNDGPYPVRPLSNISCNRPRRLGLSRKHSGKPLHAYFKTRSDTSKPN